MTNMYDNILVDLNFNRYLYYLIIVTTILLITRYCYLLEFIHFLNDN